MILDCFFDDDDQRIWEEIGESDVERDEMLLQLEQECLDVYKRKVENASKYKADLHQALAEAEAEAANIVSGLGEQVSFSRFKGSLKEQLMSAMKPILEDLRWRREERSVRLQKVNGHLNSIHELSAIMSVDYLKTLSEVHPSLVDSGNGQPKTISNDTLGRLTGVVHSLTQEKQQRLQKLQDLGSTLIELWTLMDTPADEQKRFDHVTCLSSASVEEVSRQGCLALDILEQAKLEIERSNLLKSSKMKELVLKRQSEIEDIYRAVHIDVDTEAA